MHIPTTTFGTKLGHEYRNGCLDRLALIRGEFLEVAPNDESTSYGGTESVVERGEELPV